MVQPDRPMQIEQITDRLADFFGMLAGMDLDLFTPLDDGPLTAAELASALGVDAGKLSLLLCVLAVAGLLTDQQHLGVGGALAEDRLGGVAVQVAGRAVGRGRP